MNITDVLRSHGVGVGKKLKGNAQPGDVLSGKTFSNVDGNDKIGDMPNQGQKILTPGTANIAIPAGYHNGTGYVVGDANLISANIKSGKNIFGVAGNSSVVDTSPGTAAAGDMLSGKIAFVDGAQLTGNMTNRGAYNITPGATNKTIPAGYHNGAGVVYGDADLVAANIRAGKNIFGVDGTLTPVETGRVIYAANNKIGLEKGMDTRPYDYNTLSFNVDDATRYAYNAIALYASDDPSDPSEISVVSSSTIDLTPYSKMICQCMGSPADGSWTTDRNAYLIASTSKNGDYSVYNARITVAKTRGAHTILDISSLSGNYYLRIHARCSPGYSLTVHIPYWTLIV